MDGRITSPRTSRSANNGDDAHRRSSHSDYDPGEFSDIPFGDGEDDGESLRPRTAVPPAPTMVQLPKHHHSARPAPVVASDEYVEPIDPEFLKELPPELQQELLLEHAAAQKRANDAAIQRAMLNAAATSEEEEDSTASHTTSSDAAEAARWTCHVCTFANHPEILACEICEALRADVAGYYDDENVGRRSRAGSVSSGSVGYSKLAQRIQSSVFSSSLKKLKMPATPATTSMTQKDDPTAEDLLIAATMKIQQLQTSATQGVQSLMAKASASRRASSSSSELLSPTSAAAFGKKPSAQAVALLRSLQQDLNTKCEPGDELYETLLRRLWDAIYQDAPRSPRKTGPAPLAPPLPRRAFERVSDGWVDIGFQGPNPDTDFRGGGLLALKCLVYVCEAYPHKMIEVVSAQRPSDSGKQWYPVCVAGVNLTCMIAGLLRLGDGRFASSAAPYWALFEEPSAFYQLYFHAFVKMDGAWHRMNGSYMEFGVVLKATRRMLEHILELAPQSLTQLGAAADKTLIDRFVATASQSYLADTENGECPDPFNLLEDENEELVTSPRAAIAAVLHKLTGLGAPPSSASSSSSAAAASSRSPPRQ